MNKALFLDRDGVINVERDYIYKIEDFDFLDGVFETLKYFQDKGYLLFIVTNQSGIGRGFFTASDFGILTDWMLQQFEAKGIHISKVYFSPYHPEFGIGEYKKDSLCRKPNPGMILQAQREFDLDLAASILVGDRESDIETGKNAGVGLNILVKSGYTVDLKITKADRVVDDLKSLRTIITE
jgi:D-glycero-D-manno-heptose 1,7-bisphosphate phosphatase